MAVDCENSYLSPEDQLKSLITKDAEGNLAIRVVEVEACLEDGINCDTNHLSLAELIVQCIGVSDCGKPALRLAKPAAPVLP